MEEIFTLIKARVPIIWVLTHEEQRFISDFYNEISLKDNRQTWVWSLNQGLVKLEKEYISSQPASGPEKGTNVISKALDHITSMNKATSPEKSLIYIMRDLHISLVENVTRHIRDIHEHLIGEGKTLIITAPILAHGSGGTKAGLPSTLEKQVSVVNYELPTESIVKNKIIEILDEMKQNSKNKDKEIKLEYEDIELTEFGRALRGLTLFEVENACATCLTHMKILNTEKLIQEKKQIVSRGNLLEFITDHIEPNEVGGLDLLKNYLNRYKLAHTQAAADYGVEPLRGIILAGIPGVGKSLTARMVASLWKLPLLRLDIGKMMGSLVGNSEANMRNAIAQIESCAPAIVWIDELEKGLSGTKSSNHSDGGTLARVFSTLLYAMQEGLKGCTIFATSNDITKLPPELIRRFNEVFFVGLPGPDERWDIFSIHLRKRDRDIKKFEKYKASILSASVDYTGAEIEKAIKDAIAEAFCSERKDVNYKDIIQALKNTKPIIQVMRKQIKAIEEEARGKYRYASSHTEEQHKTRKLTTKQGKKLDVNDALDDLPEIQSNKKKQKEELNSRDSRFTAVANES